MSPTRPRRIVRRAVLALAVAVLVVSGYIGSYGAARWLCGRGQVGKKPSISNALLASLDETIFLPVHSCSESGSVPALWVSAFGFWCYRNGEDAHVAWSDIIVTEDGLETKDGLVIYYLR